MRWSKRISFIFLAVLVLAAKATLAGEPAPTGAQSNAPGATGPTAGVDPETKAKVKDLIKKLGDEDAEDRY